MPAGLYGDEPDLHHLSKDQLFALNIASLVGGSLSVVSVLVASYWFVRMRRSFRHDLIMLLMQSDMLKATWFTIYPIVQLASGVIKSNSAFCQVSGFFLAVGIEACDVAVVLVALHTALSISHRGTTNGLQPYRRVAYALFVTVPLLLASLAFINRPGYANSGEYCYLPLHPDWARRSLSWTPRYIIFITILIIYASIYIRVALLLKKYSQRTRLEHSPAAQPKRNSNAPPLHRMSTYGLIPSTVPSRRASIESTLRCESLFSSFLSAPTPGSRRSSGASAALTSGPKKIGQTVKWKLPYFGAAHVRDSSSIAEAAQSVFRERIATGEPPALPPPSQRMRNKSFETATNPLRLSRSPRQPNLLAILRPGQPCSSSRTPSSVFLSPTTGMTEMREHVVRQTRSLFIYPLVYLGVWLIPLISHLMGGDRLGAPFGVMITGLVSLAIQGFVDAVVFSLREKPWRNVETSVDNRHTIWPCYDEQHGTHGSNPGRSVEDMVTDRRIARWRLDKELEERRLERLAGRPTTLDWWEHEHRRVLVSVDSISEQAKSVTEDGTERSDSNG